MRMHVDLQVNFIVCPGINSLSTSRTCVGFLCMLLQMLQEKPWRCKSDSTLTCHPPWKYRGQRHDAPVSSVILTGLTVSCIDRHTLLHSPSVHLSTICHCSLQLTFLSVNHHVIFAVKGLPTNTTSKHWFDIVGI